MADGADRFAQLAESGDNGVIYNTVLLTDIYVCEGLKYNAAR